MDIKTSFEIGLSPALEGFLTRLIGKPQGFSTPTVERTTADKSFDQPHAGHNDDAERQALQDERDAVTERGEGPQEEAPRRTRRTKAQMEADAASGTTGSTAHSDTQENLGSDGTGQIAMSDASPSDLATALEAEPQAREGVTAKADVAAKMQEAMAATSPKKVQDRMAADLNGAKRLSEIDPSLYGKAIETFDAIIAGA